MSDKITGEMKKELNGRIKALPKEYQVVFYEIIKYLWQFASSEADVLNMQIDIIDMFEAGVQNGKNVLDIVGDDIIGFCDGILGAVPEHTWMGKMKLAMNKNIHKKLSKSKRSEK